MIDDAQILDGGPIVVTKFNEDSAIKFVQDLNKKSLRDDSEPIVITIDSYGGELYSLMTMIDAIDALENRLIITHCLGKAMSCGAVLLSVGHIRYASPHSTIMIHEASAGAVGNINDIKVDLQETERLNSIILNILASRMKLKGGVNALKKMFTNEKRDLFLTPTQAKKLKVIDRIGSPKISVTIKWEVR